MSFSKKIVTTYSKGLLQTVISLPADKSKDISLYSIGEELNLLRSLLVSSKLLKILFANPTISEKKKLALLKGIFPGLSKLMRAFLKILTEKGDLRLLPEIADEYNETLLKFQGITKVRLYTASILEEHYGLFLLKTLKTLTNSKEVILNVTYSPRLLGGLILEYNSTSTDASLLKEFSLFCNEG